MGCVHDPWLPPCAVLLCDVGASWLVELLLELPEVVEPEPLEPVLLEPVLVLDEPVDVLDVLPDVPVVLDVPDVLCFASAVAATPETSPTVMPPAAATVATAATTDLVWMFMATTVAASGSGAHQRSVKPCSSHPGNRIRPGAGRG